MLVAHLSWQGRRSEKVNLIEEHHLEFGGQVSSFKSLYDEKCANCNLTFFRESQNAGRERFAKAPRKNPRRTASRKLSRKSNFLCMSCCLCG